jgi:MerR family transcriptional regulator, light-induced transcriptional regulator
MSGAPGIVSPAPSVVFTAGAAAAMLRIPPSTLRAWHRRYQLPLEGQRAGRHRRYTAADIDALARMCRLIAEGVATESAAALAFHPVTDPDSARVDQVIDAAARLDADSLVALFGAHLDAHGVVDTWDRLCRPALSAYGGPHAADAARCVDVVHVLSWAIMAALHQVPTAAGPAGRPVLLACVEGERHTLALEALRAALAQRGVAARMLGANVEVTALRAAVRRGDVAPAALVLWAGRAHDADVVDFAALARPRTRLVVVGPGWTAHQRSRRLSRPATLPAAVELLTARTLHVSSTSLS